MKRSYLVFAAALALLAFGATPAMAAHNGNNKGELTGVADPDATGSAIVNYSEGRGTFNGTITVQNLEPGETYSFFVRGAGAGATGVLICSGEASAQGVFNCQDQNRPLPGFTQAVVRDSAGLEVASGTFARRGNCRDPEQVGSQCDAPGQNK